MRWGAPGIFEILPQRSGQGTLMGGIGGRVGSRVCGMDGN